jgi:ATP-dependent helicase/nuclease subunit B
VRTLWRARFESYVEALASAEADRLLRGKPIALERRGEMTLPPGILLTCEADRIDRATDGTAILYDYKTGTLPSDKQIDAFAKQLHLEAMIAEAGGFDDLPPLCVSEITYLRINTDLKTRSVKLTAEDVGIAREQFMTLMGGFLNGQRGFTARRMPRDTKYVSEYDHLSRFGEWDQTDTPHPEAMP